MLRWSGRITLENKNNNCSQIYLSYQEDDECSSAHVFLLKIQRLNELLKPSRRIILLSAKDFFFTPHIFSRYNLDVASFLAI